MAGSWPGPSFSRVLRPASAPDTRRLDDRLDAWPRSAAGGFSGRLARRRRQVRDGADAGQRCRRRHPALGERRLLIAAYYDAPGALDGAGAGRGAARGWQGSSPLSSAFDSLLDRFLRLLRRSGRQPGVMRVPSSAGRPRRWSCYSAATAMRPARTQWRRATGRWPPRIWAPERHAEGGSRSRMNGVNGGKA